MHNETEQSTVDSFPWTKSSNTWPVVRMYKAFDIQFRVHVHSKGRPFSHICNEMQTVYTCRLAHFFRLFSWHLHVPTVFQEIQIA